MVKVIVVQSCDPINEMMRVIQLVFKLRFLQLFGAAISIFVIASFSYASEMPLQEALCEVYNKTYRGANKAIASTEAEGLGDNSAPRESNRQLRILNERIQQLIVIQQMHAHGCTVPKVISSGIGYKIHAMECQLEIITGNANATECDKSNWISVLESLEHFQ